MYLRGRIDRIDYNEQTGDWLLLDYKTRMAPTTRTRFTGYGDSWIDLQLPALSAPRHGARCGRPLRLGYIGCL